MRTVPRWFFPFVAACLGLATLAFSYHSVAGARALRFERVSGDGLEVIDTWAGEYCILGGRRCVPLLPDTAFAREWARESTPRRIGPAPSSELRDELPPDSALQHDLAEIRAALATPSAASPGSPVARR